MNARKPGFHERLLQHRFVLCCAALLLIVLWVALWRETLPIELTLAHVIPRHGHRNPPANPEWTAARLRFYETFFLLGIASVLLLFSWPTKLQETFKRMPRAGFAGVCLLICAAGSLFIVHFGRMQFGGYDFDILVDLGWRTYLGQQPYRDFITYMPPGFIFGLKYAFRLFGPHWDANLYATAVMWSGAFCWMTALLRRLQLARSYALLVAFAVDAAAILPLCFWWYNDTAELAAAVFFLSCFVCCRDDLRSWDLISYAASLGLLLLMKPNIAGLAVVLCILFLLLFSKMRWLLLLFTAGGVLLTVLFLLSQHVSPAHLLAEYRAIAADRGGLSLFGFHQLTHGEKLMTIAWLATLCLPLLVVVPRALASFRERRWNNLALYLLLLAAPLLAIYGVMTNGEWRDVDCTVLLAADGVALLAPMSRLRLQLLFAALLVGNAAADIAYGVQRVRVYTIGPHQYFEWGESVREPDSGFLAHMSVSHTFVRDEGEIQAALAGQPRPVFFGPRLAFNYAVIGQPSPEHIALFFEPGTAFPRADTETVLQHWKQMRFPTLVFLRGDYTYYPPEFQQILSKNYVRDDHFPDITIYHLR